VSTAEERKLAGRAVFAKIIADEVRAVAEAVKAEVKNRLVPGEHVTATLADGTRIGKVTLTEVPRTADIVDERALIDWLLEHRPDEVVPQVRPSFLEHLRRQVKEHGHAFDETTGEVIPGIELGEGTPGFRPAPSEEGRALVKARLNELLAGGLLELPPAEGRRAS
jgi:hypothetical protein